MTHDAFLSMRKCIHITYNCGYTYIHPDKHRNQREMFNSEIIFPIYINHVFLYEILTFKL